MDKIMKNKSQPGAKDQPFFTLQSKFRNIPLLVMYYLSKFEDYCKVVFKLFQKLDLLIYTVQFMTS